MTVGDEVRASVVLIGKHTNRMQMGRRKDGISDCNVFKKQKNNVTDHDCGLLSAGDGY